MKKVPFQVGHSRIPLTSRTLCGLTEFTLPPGHGLAWRQSVTCAECLTKMEAKRQAPLRAADKALVTEHFARKREVAQARKGGVQ